MGWMRVRRTEREKQDRAMEKFLTNVRVMAIECGADPEWAVQVARVTYTQKKAVKDASWAARAVEEHRTLKGKEKRK